MPHPRLGLALLAAARGPGRPGSVVVFRASARADSRMGARAYVGLRPGGQEAGRAWRSGEDGAKQTRLETMVV